MPKKYPGTYKIKRDGKVIGWRYRYYFAKNPETGKYPIPNYKDYFAKTQEAAYAKGQADNQHGARTAADTVRGRMNVSPCLGDFVTNEYLTQLETDTRHEGKSWGRFEAQKSRMERFITKPEIPKIKALGLASIKLAALTPDDVTNLFREMANAQTGFSVRRDFRRELNLVFRAAKKHLTADWRSYTEDIPEIQRPRNLPQRTIFDYEDILKVIYDESKPLEPRLFVAFIFTTMCRPSEMWALEWDDINFKKAEVHISKAVRRGEDGFESSDGTKTAERNGRVVPLIPEVLKMLKARRKAQDGPYVFQTPSGHQINGDRFSGEIWPRIRQSLGLPEGPVFYAVKHAGNSYLDSKAVPSTHRAALMGHASDRMARSTYLRVNEAVKRSAVTAFEKPLQSRGAAGD